MIGTWSCVRWAVVSGLAGMTLACSGPEAPPTTVVAEDTADQVFFGLTHTLTLEGVLRARLYADTAHFFQNSQRAELRRVQVVFFSPQGQQTSRLTSEAGTYDWRSGNMQARGSVVAVTPDNRRLRTSMLEYDRARDRLSGPESFVFDAPDRHLEGESFEADPDFRNVVTTRPRRGRVGSGGGTGPP